MTRLINYAAAYVLCIAAVHAADNTDPVFPLPGKAELTVHTENSAALLSVKKDGAYIKLINSAGPVWKGEGGATLSPTNYTASLVGVQPSPDGVECTYETHYFEKTQRWTVRVQVKDQSIILNYRSEDPACAGVNAGIVPDGESWTGYAVPDRVAEDYPQHGHRPDLFYQPRLGLWFRGTWDFDASNASADRTSSQEPQLTGKDVSDFPGFQGGSDNGGPLSWSRDLIYTSQLDSKASLPLNETFVIRVGTGMWDAVSKPTQEASPYLKDLKEEVFVDYWGGSFELGLAVNRWMRTFAEGLVSHVTLIQDWQGGGFDSHLPLAITPELPVNPAKGKEETLRTWLGEMKTWGRAGLRTNYLCYRNTKEPRIQTVPRALGPDGKEKWHTRIPEVMATVDSQEKYIKELFATNACFSDQITSGGVDFPYVDFSPDIADPGTLRGARANLRSLATRIKTAVGGPLFSETLNSEYLIGEFVDSGDYGLFEGHNRPLTPDYKLRTLHPLSVYYGAGLPYRYFFAPPYGGNTKQAQGNQLYAARYQAGADDYRAVTLLYGNGGYVYFYPWIKRGAILSEFMTLGLLQRYYAGEPVMKVEYRDGDQWTSLEELLKQGHNPAMYYGFIRVEYRNGFRVFVNRGEITQEVTLPQFGKVTLPKYSYAAFSADGKVEAFSGIPARSEDAKRIDYTRDDLRKVRFVDPRGGSYDSISVPTVFRDGKPVFEEPLFNEPASTLIPTQQH
ncbi:MAG: hypothetical protein ACFUZC_11180 [Chthoniobacteraceae bacterium]